MLKRITVYAAIIAGLAAFYLWRQGSDPAPGRLLVGLLLVGLFAWLIWLRWDWAPEAYRRRREAEEAPPRGPSVPSTDEAGRP